MDNRRIRFKIGRHWLIASFLAVAGLSSAFLFVDRFYARPLRFPDGVASKDIEVASQRFQNLYERQPTRLDLLSMIGELSVRNDRLVTAAACFSEIRTETQPYGLSARLQEGQILVKLNQAKGAERSFRQYLDAAISRSVPHEQFLMAYKQLAYLLSVELRFEDRKIVLLEMEKRGIADVQDSKQLYFPNLLIWNSSAGRQRLSEFLQQNPDDPTLLLASCRYLTMEGELGSAQHLLEQLFRNAPQNPNIAAALIECLYEQADWAKILEIANTLPAYSSNESWLLTRFRGEIELHQGHWSNAVHYFQRVLEVDPANPWSYMGLARAFGELQQPIDREKSLQMSLGVAKLRSSLGTVREETPEMVQRLADLCLEVGLNRPSEIFHEHALRIKREANVNRSQP